MKSFYMSCYKVRRLRTLMLLFLFLNYLHESVKLAPFMNAATTNPRPSHDDFKSYLEWAAKHFALIVAYGMHAVDVQAVKTRLPIGLWLITAQDRDFRCKEDGGSWKEGIILYERL